MKKHSIATAKSFLKMAEADRKLLVFTNALNTVFTASLVIKLIISTFCLINSEK